MESVLVLEKRADGPLRRAAVNAGADRAGEVSVAFPSPIAAILDGKTSPRQLAGCQRAEHDCVVLSAVIRLLAKETGAESHP